MSAAPSVEGLKSAEVSTRPVEAIRSDVEATGIAALRKRNEGIEQSQRLKDPLAVFRATPNEEVFKRKGTQDAYEMPFSNLPVRGAFEVNGQPQTVDASVTSLVGRNGELMTVRLQDGTTREVPISLLEVSQLASELDAQLPSFSEEQRPIVEAMIRDYRGEQNALTKPGLDDDIQKAATALGLTRADDLRSDINAMRNTVGKAGQHECDAVLGALDGRLVVDATERQAARESILQAERDARAKTLTVDDLNGFIKSLPAADMLLPKGTTADVARQQALDVLANGAFDGATVMKALNTLGVSPDGMRAHAATLTKSIDKARTDLLAANTAYKDAEGKAGNSQSGIVQENFAVAKAALAEAKANLNSLAREQQMYQLGAEFFASGAQGTEQLLQGLIDGNLPTDRAPQIVEAFRTGDMGPLVIELTNNILEGADTDPAAAALQHQAIIDEWKKRGKEGGVFALLALIAALTSALQLATGGR